MPLLDYYIVLENICIFSKASCPYCIKAIELLKTHYTGSLDIIDIGTIPQGPQISQELHRLTQQRTVPNIFIFGKHIGGFSDLKQLHLNGELLQMLQPPDLYVCEFCGKGFNTPELRCNCFPRQFSDWGEPR